MDDLQAVGRDGRPGPQGRAGNARGYWKITKPSERGDTDGEDEAGGGKRGSFFVRYYNVFNLAQVDGATLPADTAPELPESERIAHADAFVAALPGIDLRHGGGMAFYMPSQDRVQMPPFADFKNAEGCYSVLYHELTHWVGGKSRLEFRASTHPMSPTRFSAGRSISASCASSQGPTSPTKSSRASR